MLDIIEIVHINQWQCLAYVYITIIGQLNGNQTKWLNWYEHNSNLKYWTIKSVLEMNFER